MCTQWSCWQYKKTVEKIQFQWIPEQISGYAKRHNLFSISHECIYQYILKDKQKGGSLYKHLRHQSKRYGSPKRQGAIKNYFILKTHI